jgi:hypothetical protein
LESSKNPGKGGSMNSAASTFKLGDDVNNRQYRAILSFDTSAIPDTAVIQSAVLKIYKSGSTVGTNPFSWVNPNPLYVDIRKGYFGTSSVLELADFNASASAGKVAAFGNYPTSGWYSATLNTTGRNYINKAGLTQLRLYFNMATNANNVADYINFVSGEGTNKPQLIINYNMP